MLHETLSIGNLHAYINVFRTVNTMRASQLFEDFATINFKAAKLVNFAVESTGQVLAPVECSSPERLTTTRLEQLARQLHDDRIYLATTPESSFMWLGFHIAATYDSVGETGGWNALPARASMRQEGLLDRARCCHCRGLVQIRGCQGDLTKSEHSRKTTF